MSLAGLRAEPVAARPVTADRAAAEPIAATPGIAPVRPPAPGIRMPRVLPLVLLPAADAVVLVAAVFAAGAAVWSGFLYALVVLGVLAAEGQHRLRICLRAGDQLPRLLIAVAAPAVLLPWTPVWLGCAAAGAVVTGRAAVCAGLRAVHRRGLLMEPVLVVGAGELGTRISRALRDHPEFGLLPQGFLDDHPNRTVPVLGPPDRLAEFVARHRATRVILCRSDADLVAIVRAARPLPADVCVVPRLHELGMAVPQASLDEVWGVPLVPLRRFQHGAAARIAKRLFDVPLAAVLLVLLAPLLLGLALAVRFGGGGVFFRQRRVTGAGRTTEVVKLRTLARGAPQGWSVAARDTTAFASWLRGTHFDELPQLVHVLRGRMSLVGPRPERPRYAERFARELPRYADRHRVRGGMTGWAQVHGLHGDTSIPDRAEFDNRYIEDWSPWVDVVVVARTAAVVLATAMGGGRR